MSANGGQRPEPSDRRRDLDRRLTNLHWISSFIGLFAGLIVGRIATDPDAAVILADALALALEAYYLKKNYERLLSSTPRRPPVSRIWISNVLMMVIGMTLAIGWAWPRASLVGHFKEPLEDPWLRLLIASLSFAVFTGFSWVAQRLVRQIVIDR